MLQVSNSKEEDLTGSYPVANIDNTKIWLNVLPYFTKIRV